MPQSASHDEIADIFGLKSVSIRLLLFREAKAGRAAAKEIDMTTECPVNSKSSSA